ncbi:MAG TPA: transglutaminase domain-containing protein, partial [bacterium]|nr:transglutaminase domain-containing protein [bacterium]
ALDMTWKKVLFYFFIVLFSAATGGGIVGYYAYEKYYRPMDLDLWKTRNALAESHAQLQAIYPEYEHAKQFADSLQTFIPLQSGLNYPMESERQYYYHDKMFNIIYDTKRYLEQKRRKQESHFLELVDHVMPHEKHLRMILDSIGVKTNDTLHLEKNAQAIMDFVQCIPYQSENRAYTKMPLETLYEGGGDCEDLAVLAYSLLTTAGIEAVLVVPTRTIASIDHATVAIHGNFTGQYIEHNQKRFFIAESAGTTDARKPKRFKIGRAEKYNISLVLGDSLEVAKHEVDWIIKEKLRTR